MVHNRFTIETELDKLLLTLYLWTTIVIQKKKDEDTCAKLLFIHFGTKFWSPMGV